MNFRRSVSSLALAAAGATAIAQVAIQDIEPPDGWQAIGEPGKLTLEPQTRESGVGTRIVLFDRPLGKNDRHAALKALKDRGFVPTQVETMRNAHGAPFEMALGVGPGGKRALVLVTQPRAGICAAVLEAPDAKQFAQAVPNLNQVADRWIANTSRSASDQWEHPNGNRATASGSTNGQNGRSNVQGGANENGAWSSSSSSSTSSKSSRNSSSDSKSDRKSSSNSDFDFDPGTTRVWGGSRGKPGTSSGSQSGGGGGSQSGSDRDGGSRGGSQSMTDHQSSSDRIGYDARSRGFRYFTPSQGFVPATGTYVLSNAGLKPSSLNARECAVALLPDGTFTLTLRSERDSTTISVGKTIREAGRTKLVSADGKFNLLATPIDGNAVLIGGALFHKAPESGS